MNINSLSELIRTLEDMRAEKERLEDALKDVNAHKERQEQEIITAMMDLAEQSGLDSAAAFSVVVDGRKYGVSIKSYYSIKAEDRDEAFSRLRDLGLGDLIKESVDQRTLTSTLNTISEGNDGSLPEEYATIPMSVYEKSTLTRRKA